MYFQGYLTGYKVAEEVALPFSGVIDQIWRRSSGRNRSKSAPRKWVWAKAHIYTQSPARGSPARAKHSTASQYAGPAPVPLQVYTESILRQARGRMQITNRIMRQVLSNLVLSEDTFSCLGPAVNSGTSIFLYGPPGNGKTSVARAVGNLIQTQNILHPLRHLCRWAGHQAVRLGQPQTRQ